MSVRTRFAPSPTGRLHLGNVRTAAFNWLLARHHGGAFVLRIEDTDVGRTVPGSEQGILEDLRWLGLEWDEGPDVGGPYAPYRQSERAELHRRAADRLLEQGLAYPCFCGEEDEEPADAEAPSGPDTRAAGGQAARAASADSEAARSRDADGHVHRRYSGRCRRIASSERERRLASGAPHVVRFAVPEAPDTVEIEDEVFGPISVPASDLDDFVILRSDGRATYNFAVVVDDAAMEITHVVRGVGHLSNTPKQALLFDALGVRRPVFAHLPTVLAPEGGKLAKRHGSAAVAELRAQGYPPDAVLNYLSLLGWSHPEEREVLSREELVEAIGLDRVGRSDARVDPEKLRWVASQHVQAEAPEELARHVRPFIDVRRFPSALERPIEVVEALRTRLSTYGEINEHLAMLFPMAAGGDGEGAPAGGALDEPARGVLQVVRAGLEDAAEWRADALSETVREAGREAGARGAALFHPVRFALIGSESGPDLGKILAAIGRAEALRRIDDALGVE